MIYVRKSSNSQALMMTNFDYINNVIYHIYITNSLFLINAMRKAHSFGLSHFAKIEENPKITKQILRKNFQVFESSKISRKWSENICKNQTHE
jgi:hypothetical protein